jgi:predicted metalloprotease with PDZ domain
MSISSKTADSLRKANLRLCRLQLWTNYNGFGFTLESSLKPPYIVEIVEPYSPADTGGLQTEDAILAIDNYDVSSADSDQVIDAIKDARDGNGIIELLVIQKCFYRSLIKKNIQFNVKFASIINTPQTMPIDYQNYFKYQPRSCEIYLNRLDEKFGFDLSENENEIGGYIKKIHPNTPASKSLLRQNDQIIEINDEYVNEKRRKSIYKRLDKAKLKRYVKLYVMDIETYKHYQVNKIPLSSKKNQKHRM